MNNLIPVLFISIGFLSTFVFLYFLIPFLSRFVLDQPNKRSSHLKITPTGGGIAFILVSQFLFILNGSLIPLICLPLAIIGFIDDKFNVSSSLRYLIQVFTSALLVANSSFFQSILNESSIQNALIFLLLLFLGTAIINFINFMDGLDGLVGGCLLIGFMSLSFVSDINLLIISGSIIGFLFWNWHPAKTFMGDCGSTFLAACFFGFILESNKLSNIFYYLIILFPIFADSIMCLLIRLINRQNIFKPHKLHLYQRLHQAGISHSNVSLIYISVCIINSLTLSIYNQINLLFFLLPEFLFGLYLSKYKAVPFKKKYS